MAERSSIQWCDHTHNEWIGCEKVSTAATGGGGCDNCYAEVSYPVKMMGIQWGPRAPRHLTAEANRRKPFYWNRAHERFFAVHGRRQRVFAMSLSDWADNKVPAQWRLGLLATIRATPNLDWLLLTKRVGNVEDMVSEAGGWPTNAQLGISITTQKEVDRDVSKALQVKQRLGIRALFISAEPCLEELDFTAHLWGRAVPCDGCPRDADCTCGYQPRKSIAGEATIDQIIVGGESGPKARDCNIDHVRSIVRQCQAAGVAVFVKQLGARPVWSDDDEDSEPPHFGRIALRDKKGGDMSEWPEDLRVREIPEVATC